MKKFLFGMAVVAAVLFAADAAQAAGGCYGPACKSKGPTAGLQTAPWYLYWPYHPQFLTPGPMTAPWAHQHFVAPAPVGGAYYGPAAPFGGAVNPYFPAAPVGPGR